MGKNTRCHLQCTKERQRPKCIFPNQFWESDREVPKTLLFYLSSPSYIVCLIWGSGTFTVLHVQIRGCTVPLKLPIITLISSLEHLYIIYYIYCTHATITRSWFETTLICKPQILDRKIEEFPCLVHKLSVTLTALQYKLQRKIG